jgi:hypothetical protein
MIVPPRVGARIVLLLLAMLTVLGIVKRHEIPPHHPSSIGDTALQLQTIERI